jgi:hypothetical protein
MPTRALRLGLRVTVVAAMLAAVFVAALVRAPVAVACSPVADPTLFALPDDAVVIVGTTGEPVEGGRQFFVERVYSGDIPSSPIVIAFKEGEPVGDCSYPVSSGMHLLIAPTRRPDGTLFADLATLQADPATEQGQSFLEEAEARYGPGTVPSGTTSPAGPGTLPIAILLGVAAGVVTIVLARNRSTGPGARPGRDAGTRRPAPADADAGPRNR